MLQKYETRRPLALRLAGATLDLAGTVPGGYARMLGRAVGDVREGRGAARAALGVGAEAVRLAADVLDVARRHELPGAGRVGQAFDVAEARTRPVVDALTRPEALAPPTPRARLRERADELLRQSAALECPDVHPAFQHVLDTLAPDEARILRRLAEHGPAAVVDVVETDRATRATRVVHPHLSFLGDESGCLRAELTPIYVDNLTRLGVVVVRPYAVAPEEVYELLRAQPELQELPRPAGRFVKRRVRELGVELSPFGRSLYDVAFAAERIEPVSR